MTSQATLLGIRNSGGRAPAPGGNESLGWRPGRSQWQSELTCCAPYSRPLITGSVPWLFLCFHWTRGKSVALNNSGRPLSQV